MDNNERKWIIKILLEYAGLNWGDFLQYADDYGLEENEAERLTDELEKDIT